MRRFDDKVVLITGAASGIGRATAQRLGQEGAKLFLCDVQAEALEESGKLAGESGAEVQTRLCDVSDPSAVDASVAACLERFARIDVLCNVAGILKFGHSHEFPVEDWNRILSVNLTGTFLMCRAALPHLVQSKGNIVNIGSTAGLAGQPWSAAYSASKGGVHSLTASLAIEYGKQGVRANSVCPGSIQTPITKAFHVPEGADAKLIYRIMPLDQHRPPEVVASTVAFIASDEAIHINGETLRVDGATLS
jgi:meso-butanediol dehydrogenase/(S,S)-butanediol dehydrogenase/diacetyl reductase